MRQPLYKCLNQNVLRHGAYLIEPLMAESMESIRTWRNQQMAVLRQKSEISEEEQERYYLQFVQPNFDKVQPGQILFQLKYEDVLIGYGGVVHLSWEDERAEMSFLVSPERHQELEVYSADFSSFIQLMKRVVFDDLKFNKLFTETYDFRKEHIGILEQCDFTLEGKMREHIKFNGQFVDSLLHSILKTENHEHEE